MRTEYRRDLSRSYLVVSGARTAAGYEVEMLRRVRVEGLLPFKVIEGEEGQQFWYDITGRQSLDGWLTEGRADRELLLRLIQGLERTCGSMRRFLLSQEGLSLHPDHIFLRPGEGELSFCFLPEYQGEVGSHFLALTEYLIQKVDHGDPSAVRTAYGLYQRAATGELDLKGCLRELKEGAEPPPLPEKGEEREEEDEGMDPSEFLETPKKPKARFRFFNSGDRKKETGVTLPPSLPPRKSYPRTDPIEETVCLDLSGGEAVGELKYLGQGNGRDLMITETPFLIGTREGTAGWLRASSVSRQHAKILRDGEGYLLEDLNSTNGTFVNGEPVNYRSPVRLRPRDRVAFADEEFLFL